MRFSLEVVKSRNFYEIIVNESYIEGETLHSKMEPMYKDLSRNRVIAEFHRLVKDLQGDYFRVHSAHYGEFPSCTLDSNTQKMRQLCNGMKGII